MTALRTFWEVEAIVFGRCCCGNLIGCDR